MKYVLVTGASGGMGRATVRVLSEHGYAVFALDRRLCEDAAELPHVIPLEADITDEASVLRVLDEVLKVTDKLFAIVHFAGIYMLDSLVEMPREKFERIFHINVFGAYLVNRSFLPLLGVGSRIVMTTSELAVLDPLPFTGIYAVTKAALDKYAYALRMEVQLLGISVSVLRAGAVKTDMLGVSTRALDDFCAGTKLYRCNAVRFKRIVDNVEAKSVSPEKIAGKTLGILQAKRPAFAYSINRNPLLRMLDVLPVRMQLWMIRRILS